MSAGFTLRQLAARVGASPAHLCLVENDHARPSLDLLSRLAPEFGLSVDALVEHLFEDRTARRSLEALAERLGERCPRLQDRSWRALLLRAQQEAGTALTEAAWLRLHAALEEALNLPVPGAPAVSEPAPRFAGAWGAARPAV
ncbi:transcriptional regulator with XRE-family HTH domain [Deinobacterium chartae]|uniref:Transcriptional regulator with XRE-family HTH domain n=1 Tax=Deinobacterium chartae TaxID=521158 RepID=A0A841I6J2_9DEIO|nr:transcriptional regulator with XRE-family HTH domain [Deinobacterium chartae]